MLESKAEYTTDPTNSIEDASNDHAYFSMIPNMLDDLLDPYQFRLYAHIKRVCGETGACWQSTSTLAERCKMSAGKVSKVKQELAEMGLIRIEEHNRPQGGLPYHRIVILDIWQRNLEHCIRPSSQDELACSQDELASSPGETKKNPQKEEPTEEEGERGASAPAPPGPPKKGDVPQAISVYRDVFRSYPRKETYGFIATAVGSQPDQLRTWARICTDWLLSGYNKYNIRGLIECFHKGQVGNGRHDGARGGGLDEFLEIAAEFGAQEAAAYGD